MKPASLSYRLACWIEGQTAEKCSVIERKHIRVEGPEQINSLFRMQFTPEEAFEFTYPLIR